MAKVKSKTKKESKKIAVSEALAVKYRPKVLGDLVGQPHVVTQIKGMMKQDRFPAAFLLEGQTGGGKTTVARILHSILNCETGNACGECPSCRMGTKAHPDLIVKNAGTEGKVDDMRKLVKGAEAAPMFNKRIIIIDEAHKLTGAAAEALLVPLEEPKPNTIWILCTTNPEKMLNTIKGRCTKFTMKPIEPKAIVKQLGRIAKKEGFDIVKDKDSKEALKLITDFSNGSMREAISLLESILYAVASGEEFTKENVLSAFIENSEVDLDRVAVSLVAASLNKDLPGTIKSIRKAGNVRGALNKARWLIDYLIGAKTKTAKYTPYSGRLFEQIAKKNDIKFNLNKLLLLQMALVDAESKMNSSPIDESVLLQTTMGGFFFKLAEYES